MAKGKKRVLLGEDGLPLRHRGWGGNMKAHKRSRRERFADSVEAATHPLRDAKFGDGQGEIDYNLLREMER